MSSNQHRNRWLLRAFALIRILVGGYWLWEQHWKLPPTFGRNQPRGLMYSFQQGIEHPTVPLYKTFLSDVVVPHFTLFGWLIFLLEVSIGLSLVLGLFKRLGATLGVLQAVNLLVAQASTPEGPWIYLGILAANLFVLLTPSDAAWSVDNHLGPALREAATRGSTGARALLALLGGSARQRTEP